MFQEAFKYYKSKNPPPDFSNVIQINRNELQLQPIELHLENLPKELNSLIHVNHWEAYELLPCPGLLLVKNSLTEFGKRYLAVRCLRDYPLPPNQTNLKTKIVSESVKSNWWTEFQTISNTNEQLKVRDSLRWVTLGLHHDWDSKVYSDEMKNDFPPDLSRLVQEIAKCLGFKSYEPEAAIVNFYPLNTTLAGHTDHSEYCNEPLFSISLGQSAIFLIGGKTKEEKAYAIMLEHGDIVVMTGESRLSYHAVPKILQSDYEGLRNLKLKEPVVSSLDGFDKELLGKINDENFWAPFSRYLSSCRININVRQVFRNKNT